MGPVGSLKDLISLLLRHGAVFTAILSAGVLATLAYALSLPAAYEATSVIQIQAGALSMGGDQLSPGRRLQLIEQRMMSRGSVLQLIAEHGLYTDLAQLSDDQKVALFRANTSIKVIDSAGRSPTEGDAAPISALIVTSRADAPDQAADVVNDMTAKLINQDKEARFAANTAALDFLRGEQERLSRQLADIDARIGAEKKDNEESLPETAESIRAEQAQLRETLLGLEQRGLELEREQLGLELSTYASAGDLANLSLSDRLRKLTGELAQARRVLPDDHPEVQRIEAEIEGLRKGGEAEALSGADRQVALVIQQRAAVERQEAEVRARQAEIAAALDAAPVIAQRLTTLGRRQSLLADQLASVALQVSQTESQRQLQENVQVGGMEVLEAAEPPRYPLSSSRRRVAAFGVAASLGAAFLVVFLMEARLPIMRTAAQVERALGVAPIAAVIGPGSATQRRWRAVNYVLMVLILTATALAASQMIANRPTSGAGLTATIAGQSQP